MRTVVRLSMALVALSAAALSYQSLARLGELCGYGGLSWLYPLVVDAGAAASCAAWLHVRSRQALGMTWALLAASVVLNGTVHYLDSTGTRPDWLLVVAVAAVPPTVLGLCVHLAVGMGRPELSDPGATVIDESAPRVERDGLSGSALVMEGDGVADRSALDSSSGGPVIPPGLGRRRLAELWDISRHQARMLLAADRDGTLTESQRAMIAAKIAERHRGGAQGPMIKNNRPIVPLPPTQAEHRARVLLAERNGAGR